MTSIILRVDTPGGLSNAQLDANFRNLNNDKVEVSYLNSLFNTGAISSTAVMRDTNGDISSRTYKSTVANTNTISGALAWRAGTDDSNNSLQFCTDKTAIRQYLGLNDTVSSSHVGSGGTAHAVATTSANGFMSNTDKSKLNSIADNANNYVHPTTDGNLHVPVTGTTNAGKVLTAGSSAGSFSWQNISTLSGLTLNDGYTEEVYIINGLAPALSPANGSIQTWTLSGDSAPTLGAWASGQSIVLGVDDGTNSIITWPAIVWAVPSGLPPVLVTTGLTWITLWKVGTIVYGKY